MASTLIGSVFIVSGLLEIIIPLIIGFYLTRRLGTSWKTWFVGALMFIVSLIRIPLNTFVSQLVLSSPNSPITFSLLVLIPSLTAGLFEETARYVGFRYLIKDDTYEKGLMYGAGHGGIESILIVGVSVLSVGVILFTSPEVLPPGQLEAILATPAYLPLVGLYERLMVMIIQIGLSIMVLESVRRKDARHLLAAIGIHALLNFMSISVAGFGVIISELLITGFAVGVGYWAYNRLRDEGLLG